MTSTEVQEWVKIIVSGLAPSSVAVLTCFITCSLNENASSLEISETIVAEKQKIYGEIGKQLNLMFVYILDVKDFRQYCPADIIGKKRDADRLFFMYQPYRSSETVSSYSAFMHAAFRMFSGAGKVASAPPWSSHSSAARRPCWFHRAPGDAQIRSYTIEKRPASTPNALWKQEYACLFAEERDRGLSKIYNGLVRNLMHDIVSSKI